MFSDLKSKTKEEIEEEQETEAHNDRLRFFQSICFAGRADEEDGRKKKPLPHWLIYIAYLLCFLTSVASAFFVILYGFQFGKMKSDQWVVSMLVSFGQSIFILQPLKVSTLYRGVLRILSSILILSFLQKFRKLRFLRKKLPLHEKCPNMEFFSGPYFSAFGLNTEIYGINLRIQSEYRKIRTRKNSVF